jgi:hypothetical protein
MTEKEISVKCQVPCADVGCSCPCGTCSCSTKDTEVKLTKETAQLVAEFSHRELG